MQRFVAWFDRIDTRRLYLVLGFMSLLSILFFGTYFYLTSVKNANRAEAVKVNPVIANDVAVPTPTATGHLTFLLLGHGGGGHSGGSLMDSIILFDIDTKAKKATIISIPRDLWIEGRKVNEGFVAGGYDLLKHQVQTVTGIFPDNYIAIDFESFKKLINTFGGIDVNIPKAYEDKYYPIKGREMETCGKSAQEFAELHKKYSGYQLEIQFECRYEDLKFSVGNTHMDGELALKYVRSRHGDGDFGRSERQFVMLNALRAKIFSLGSISQISAVVDNLFNLVSTNLNINQIKSLLSYLSEKDSYKVTEIHLTSANVLLDSKGPAGQFILSPRGSFSDVKAFIKSKL
jgi:LCP family protein required for cell wall assembly